MEKLDTAKSEFDKLIAQSEKSKTEDHIESVKKNVGSALAKAKGVTDGIGKAAGAVKLMLNKPKDDDAKVKEWRDAMLKSKYYKEGFAKINKAIEVAGLKRDKAVAAFQKCSQTITARIAALNETLAARIAIAEARQKLSPGIDAETRSAPRATFARARSIVWTTIST